MEAGLGQPQMIKGLDEITAAEQRGAQAVVRDRPQLVVMIRSGREGQPTELQLSWTRPRRVIATPTAAQIAPTSRGPSPGSSAACRTTPGRLGDSARSQAYTSSRSRRPTATASGTIGSNSVRQAASVLSSRQAVRAVAR